MRQLHRVRKIDFSALNGGSSKGHATATGILLGSGCAEFSLDRRFSVCAGDLYVIPAQAPHAFHGSPAPGTIGWGFDLGERFELRDTKRSVTRLDEPRVADLRAWLDRIVLEQRSRDACSQALCESLTRALQIECARAMGVARCENYSRVVAEALRIITKEYAASLRPRDIAERIGVTAAHLSHELQRQTGRSPSQWIMHARVEAAKSLLLMSHSSTVDVAEAVGYSDVSQLNRIFRQFTGATPAAWRRANRAHNSTN